MCRPHAASVRYTSPRRSTNTSAEAWWCQASRRGRDKCRDFFGTKRIGNVIDSQPCVLVGHENDVRALEAALAILVQIVRPKLAADLAVVLFSGDRERGDRDGIALIANIKHPDILGPIRAVFEDRFVGLDEQITR